MYVFFFFFKQKTAYEMRISDWSSDVCSSDLLTTGLHPGDLVILAGRPAMGKTSFALNIAEHTAMYEKKPALVFSMEMPAEQLALRMLSSFARIPMGNLSRDRKRVGEGKSVSVRGDLGGRRTNKKKKKKK